VVTADGCGESVVTVDAVTGTVVDEAGSSDAWLETASEVVDGGGASRVVS
jgi:hypothetical protein